MRVLKTSLCMLASAGLLAAAPAFAGKTLDAIKQRDQLVCGVNTGLAGFSQADSQGAWTGLDVDVCKAIAAAILNDPAKVILSIAMLLGRLEVYTLLVLLTPAFWRD